MRRPEFLPIITAMLLLAAACNRVDAQDGIRVTSVPIAQAEEQA